jgi:hypothetical protein
MSELTIMRSIAVEIPDHPNVSAAIVGSRVSRATVNAAAYSTRFGAGIPGVASVN